jgi:hypothetical protein
VREDNSRKIKYKERIYPAFKRNTKKTHILNQPGITILSDRAFLFRNIYSLFSHEYTETKKKKQIYKRP